MGLDLYIKKDGKANKQKGGPNKIMAKQMAVKTC